MTRRALVLFGFLVLCASSAWGQPCTPVVYAFRHAEDTNPFPPGPTFALTPTGQAHAALYPAMISDFQAAYHLCPVTKVYATTKAKKVGECGNQCASATNAFDTATPLARAVMGADPITTVANGAYQLYEYLGNGNVAPTVPEYFTPEAIALRAELLATASRYESSAVFWTSQGLHVLGGAIINSPAKVPRRDSNVPKKEGGAIPPRNAVYIFVYEAPDYAEDFPSFSDTPSDSTRPPDLGPPSSVLVQCFNHVEASSQFNPAVPQFIAPAGSPPTQRYYCGYNNEQSNLGGKPRDHCDLGAPCGTIPNDRNKDIKGKICDTTTSMLPNTSGPSIFGACN